MIRIWLAVAGVGGGTSGCAGASAPHLPDAPNAAELLRTGALYGMVHAAALLATIALAQGRRRATVIAGWSFAAGIVLFSFSLFALAGGGSRWLGWMTPFGGMALMLGWAALGSLALRRR